jgi:hypothetical protein
MVSSDKDVVRGDVSGALVELEEGFGPDDRPGQVAPLELALGRRLHPEKLKGMSGLHNCRHRTGTRSATCLQTGSSELTVV